MVEPTQELTATSTYIKWAQDEVNTIRRTQTYKWLSRRYGDAVSLDLLRLFLDDFEEEKKNVT